jgi:hypothetical protein
MKDKEFEKGDKRATFSVTNNLLVMPMKSGAKLQAGETPGHPDGGVGGDIRAAEPWQRFREALARAVEQLRQDLGQLPDSHIRPTFEDVPGWDLRRLKKEFFCAAIFAKKYLAEFGDEESASKRGHCTTTAELRAAWKALKTALQAFGEAVDLKKAETSMRERLRALLMQEWDLKVYQMEVQEIEVF